MNQSSIATSIGANHPLEDLREHLSKALHLMDELRPSSVPAARLQQILDELDGTFDRSA